MHKIVKFAALGEFIAGFGSTHKNHRRSFHCSVALLLTSIAAFGQVGARAPLAGEVPDVVLRSYQLGQKPETDTVHLAIGLTGNMAGLQNFVDAVSDPKSPIYRQFISPEEVGARFGLAMGQVQQVVNFLHANGMNVTLVAKNRLSILADATVAQAEKAFNTHVMQYKTMSADEPGNTDFFSYSTPLTAPSSIVPIIQSVSGLQNFIKPKPQYLVPSQTLTLYNLAGVYAGGTQGQGRTVAISSWDGFDLSNFTLFHNAYGLPTPVGGVGSNITVKTLDGGTQSGTQSGEGDLDYQMVLGFTPLCNLIIYDGSGGDLVNVLTTEANDNLADIISESYGWGLDSFPDIATSCHNEHLSMSAEGITYLASSGDNGTSIGSFTYPDYDPEVLMVGGTSPTTDDAGNRVTEPAWSGGGGGWSTNPATFNVTPSWQLAAGLRRNIGFRLFPDVALDADPQGGVNTAGPAFYWKGSFKIGGGTSAASPGFAGGLAAAEQLLIGGGGLPADGLGHQRYGRIANLIYAQHGRSDVWFDVISGSNGQLPDGTTSNATSGWDFTSGWGVVNFNNFAASQIPRIKISSIGVSVSTVLSGVGATGTVTLNAVAGGAGTVVNLASNGSAVSVPASVTVLAGSSTANFPITTNGVDASTTATLTGTTGGTSKTTTLTVTPATFLRVLASPASIIGGSANANLYVTLTGLAGPSGVQFTMTNSAPGAVTIPATITVPANTSQLITSVPTLGVDAPVTATILGTHSGVTKSTTLSVNPATLYSVTASPASVPAGIAGKVYIYLVGKAGPSGVPVSLSSDTPGVASVPSLVTIPAGASYAPVAVSTFGVDASTPVTITATLGGTSKSGTLNVLPATLQQVIMYPATAIGGTSTKVYVYLNGPAGPSGVSISLSSAAPSVASVPANVAFPGGGTVTSATVTTGGVDVSTPVVITAGLGGATKTGTVTVTPANLGQVIISPSSVTGGTNSFAYVYLVGKAGPSGFSVSLGSSAPGVASVPGTVAVAANSSIGVATITTSAVDASTPATITATVGSTSRSALVTVNPAALSQIIILPASVKGGVGSRAYIYLNAKAGPSGVVVSLSSNSGNATIIGSATILAGSNVVGVNISTTAVSTTTPVTISAQIGAGTPVTGTLTLTP